MHLIGVQAMLQSLPSCFLAATWSHLQGGLGEGLCVRSGVGETTNISLCSPAPVLTILYTPPFANCLQLAIHAHNLDNVGIPTAVWTTNM